MSRIADDLKALMLVPGVAGHEERVRAALRELLPVEARTDALGNLIASIPGEGPPVMLFTHMDQLGLIVRKVETDGLIRVHRLGGIPERALPCQEMILCARGGDIPAIVGMKSHHATQPDEKYKVLPATDLYLDAGFSSKAEAEAAGVVIGTPVAYRPQAVELAGGRIAGTSVDDRAGCAVLVDVCRWLAEREVGPPVHVVFATQEEFNLRGAQVAAQALRPAIAIQVDLMMATDTPDMAHLGEMRMGGGPGISLYSFHGRGTLNGVLPHPALVDLFEGAAAAEGMALQRSAQIGVLTDNSYVQLVGEGVAAIDVGFPMRYSHGPREMVQVSDLEDLSRLILAALSRIGPGFRTERG
ncbi:M20/M25/M40 family metallo-hydrolase [Roseibacterium sp. SDUM158017]|uniref:M42 family metallopeptidase n=1 Tax=Roseicyclus salinarum TaxID=3036773 RepID=UPI00241563AC|nr:M20/M25/M40 family metallo-hydrolase [Roseibacterium sp. SDUM158017]MDG4649552.1 M20/M25/M40 family metallo-hydrolase [Roseibacterium sp. SDUM158017]